MNQGSVRQRGERIERSQHLRGRTFEKPATAAGKKRVATKKMRRTVIICRLKVCDMPQGMAWHIEYSQIERRLLKTYPVSRTHGVGQMPDRLAGWPIHRNHMVIQQIGHSTDVIPMVVRE